MTVFGVVVLVVALVVGLALFGFTLSLFYYLAVGLVVGALARLVLPGREEIGLLGTALVGLAGGAVGGVAGRLLSVGGFVELILSVAAAAAMLTVFGFRAQSRTRT